MMKGGEGGVLAEVDTSVEGYGITNPTPFEIISCHGGGGAPPLVKVYYFRTVNLCYF